MHQFYSVFPLIALCIGVTSAGIVDRIQYNPIKSFFQGTKGADVFQSQHHNIPYEAAIFDDDIVIIDDFQMTGNYERPTNMFSNEPSSISKFNRRRPQSSTKRRPQSSTKRRPQSSTKRKPSTLPQRYSNTNKVKSTPLPVTGAHAVVGTHFGEIAIFTSKGRLWLNATSLERPVPLGAAKDSDSISVGNKNANEIWVNTTSWNKLVSLEDIAAGRRPVTLNPSEKRKPVKVDSDVVGRPPLSKGSISADYVTQSPIVLPERGTYQYDTCGLNLVIPLTADRIVLREQGLKPNYKSTGFPHERDYPLVCTWNIKVNKICRRARITMKVDGRSRLPDVEGCVKGYLHISPFMNQTRLCGRIDSIPPYHWYVDDQQPNDVTITMKNIGINDGYSEGLSFTLQGECLPIERGSFDVDKENVESNANWMDRLIKEMATTGYGATLADGSLKLTAKKPSLSEIHPDDGKRRVNSTHIPAVPVDQIFDDAITYITTLLDNKSE